MAAGDRDSNNRGYRLNRVIADSVRLMTVERVLRRDRV